MAVLSIEDLAVHFRTFEGEARVLNGVSLSIAEGETVALVGETGCGKSVTLKTMLRILPVPPGRIVGGRVIYKGQDLLSVSPSQLHGMRGKEIALIPQEPMSSLNPVFTVGQQLTDLIDWQGRRRVNWLSYLSRGVWDGHMGAWERGVDLLRQVNIPDPERLMRSWPVELSGGMGQRVLIAMALAGNPSLLVADEPGTALDVTTQDQILRLLKERVEEGGLSVLYVTHNLGVARQMAQRIYVMYAGEIAETAETPLLFAAPKHPYTQGLLQSIPRLTGGALEGISGRIPDYTHPPSGCRFHPRCPYAMPVCSQRRPELRAIEPAHLVACHLYEGA
ncbi:MAG: ABC transporter ATP-binding protein [Nitrospinae bacterium]|nr:ABC transporter ATP-binding protein [Nitrospinota bacterium]